MKLTKQQKRLSEHRSVVYDYKGETYALPDGTPVHARVMHNCIEKGVFKSGGDSMFGCPPQTFVRVENDRSE